MYKNGIGKTVWANSKVLAVRCKNTTTSFAWWASSLLLSRVNWARSLWQVSCIILLRIQPCTSFSVDYNNCLQSPTLHSSLGNALRGENPPSLPAHPNLPLANVYWAHTVKWLIELFPLVIPVLFFLVSLFSFEYLSLFSLSQY